MGLPDGRGSPTLENKNQFLEHMPLCIKTLARRNAADVCVIKISRTIQHDISAVTSHTVPPLERHSIEIFDKEASDDIDSLRRCPKVIMGIHDLYFAIDSFKRRCRR